MKDDKEIMTKSILETAESASAYAEARLEEVRSEYQKRRIKLMKISGMMIIVSIVLVFATRSWFTMSRDVDWTGANMTAANSGYELKVSGDNIGYSDLYSFLDPSFSKNTDKQTNATEDGDTIRWRIAGSSDILKPGSQGVLEFNIISTGADVTSLHYNLNIECYTATSSGTGESETVTGLTKITSTSGSTANEIKGAKYLKTHLMFFKARTGETESTYQYSGFIDNISDFTLTPEATSTVGEYSAKIYWIWPNTIGQVLLNSTSAADRAYLGSSVTSVMNCEVPTEGTNDRTKMTAYLQSNYSDIFNGSENYSNLITALYSNRSADPAVSFRTQYDKLSTGYNAADLLIGKNVDYVSVLLNSSKS